MPARRSHILALAMLPALWGCGASAPEGPPPPSAAARSAILDSGGAQADALGRAIDSLFDTPAVGDTQALLVLKGGKVVVERYGPGIEAATRLSGWSASACMTALMTGALVSDGRLRLDESAPIAAWQRNGDPRGEITLRQLLQMRSGLRFRDSATPERESDRFRMVFLDGRDDMAGYAEAQPLEAPAGRTFAFTAATGPILADAAARALADGSPPPVRRAALEEFLRSRLFAPIGMDSASVSFDRAGTLSGGDTMLASARDWAKLGEFIRHKGSVVGAQILPRRWMEVMLAPSPRYDGYGAGVWLATGRKSDAAADDAADDDPPDAPLDAREPTPTPTPTEPASPLPASLRKGGFGCVGDYGQFVLGSPAQLLTVVRLGVTPPGKVANLRDRLGALLALFPSN